VNLNIAMPKPSRDIRYISVFAASMFMFAIVMSLYFATKINLSDYRTFAYGITAGFFLFSGFTVKLAMGVRLRPDVFMSRDALDVGVMGAVIIAIVQAVAFLSGLMTASSLVGGLIVIMMAVSEEYFFTSLLDLLGATTGDTRRGWYSNFAVAGVFAVFHKSVYGLRLVVVLVLFLGRLILNWCYLRGGLDASLVAHLLINSLAVVGGG